jgi:hypothetical protein
MLSSHVEQASDFVINGVEAMANVMNVVGILVHFPLSTIAAQLDVDPIVARYHGAIHHCGSEGILVVFYEPTVKDFRATVRRAVRCAIHLAQLICRLRGGLVFGVAVHCGRGWRNIVQADRLRLICGGTVLEELWEVPLPREVTVSATSDVTQYLREHEYIFYDVIELKGRIVRVAELRATHPCSVRRVVLCCPVLPLQSRAMNVSAAIGKIVELPPPEYPDALQSLYGQQSRFMLRTMTSILNAAAMGRVYKKHHVRWVVDGLKPPPLSPSPAVFTDTNVGRELPVVQTAYDRVESKLAERHRAVNVVDEESALFQMFVFDDPADALKAEGTEEDPHVLVDHRGRRWIKGHRVLGVGAFAKVINGVGEFGTPVAIKCFDLESRVLSASAEELSSEIQFLSSLRHDNLVSYIGDCIVGNSYYVIMECVSVGSLADCAKRFVYLPPLAVAHYVRDALLGLQYLHDSGVTHCDIKPHNLLLAASGKCKVSDFGSCINTQLGESPGSPVGCRRPGSTQEVVRGTAAYMAPEACRGDICAASDIWSLGITTFELLTSRLPWELCLLSNESRFIANHGKLDSMTPDISPLRDTVAGDFVARCLRRDPEKRDTIAVLLKHPFVVENIGLLPTRR